MEHLNDDHAWMEEAFRCAEQAYEMDEVPVGAVIVLDGEIIGRGWNRPIISHDPTAHAEIAAIREACQRITNYRIPGATMYVTLEPCAMCVGAMIHARISRLVYGATEPKSGAVVSRAQLLQEHPFNWTIECQGGVREKECSELISDFFRHRRAQKRRINNAGAD